MVSNPNKISESPISKKLSRKINTKRLETEGGRRTFYYCLKISSDLYPLTVLSNKVNDIKFKKLSKIKMKELQLHTTMGMNHTNILLKMQGMKE